MSSIGEVEDAIRGKPQIDHEKLAKHLSLIFIIMETVLIISTVLLFFTDLGNEFKWVSAGLMIIVSIVAVLLAWFIDVISNEATNSPICAIFTSGSTKKSTPFFPIALGIVTLVVVVVPNIDIGYLAYLVGFFGGLLVWILSVYLLGEKELSGS